jgi:signal transduction histidine kinase
LQEDLKSLRGSGDELNRYIQSILKVLRVESRDFKVNKEVADINEIIEEAIAQLRPLATEKNIRIQTELEPMFSVEFDTILIKEVLVNLIDNAIKYTPRNGQISIYSNETEDSIFVKVKDNGEGIRPEDLDNVWGKFTRGKDQEMKSKGSGLGLYLVKYFIELHGGKVDLQSKVGFGSTVSFTLPLSDDTSDNSSDNFQEVIS